MGVRAVVLVGVSSVGATVPVARVVVVSGEGSVGVVFVVAIVVEVSVADVSVGSSSGVVGTSGVGTSLQADNNSIKITPAHIAFLHLIIFISLSLSFNI